MRTDVKEANKFTGERFIPGIQDEGLLIEHLQRYRSVTELVHGKYVVDIACGEGYGTAILADNAKMVVGFDIDTDTVIHAKKMYQKENLTYLKGDISQVPLADHTVDILISFETIEHVEERKQWEFLKESKRLLKEDGLFIVSTPNKKIYSDQKNYSNEFHIKEFYEDEFVLFLKTQFPFVSLYQQYDEVTNIIMQSNNKIPAHFFQEGQREGKYMIAIASMVPVPNNQIACLTARNEKEYERSIGRILQLQDEVEKRNAHLTNLDNIIKKNDKEIKNLQNENEIKNALIQKLDDEICLKGNRIDELQIEIKAKNEHIQTMDDAVLELDQKIADQNHRITALKKYEENEVVLQQELLNKEGHIELLLVSDRELQRIYTSKTWKYLSALWKTKDSLVPNNSKRFLILKLGATFIHHPIRSLRLLSPRKIRNFFHYLKHDGTNFVTRRMDESILGLKLEQKLSLQNVVPKENKTIDEYQVLHFPEVREPLISILIPVYNQFEYTYQCLKSILTQSDSIPYEIIIGNDCSTDLTTQLEQIVTGITVIDNKENMRFLKNCNYMASCASGTYLLFLNNDTQVQENWLQPLVTLIESRDDIGMVGSKLVYADGCLQEAGGIMWKDASAWNYGNRCDAAAPEYNYVKEVDYISGAAVMIRANLWNIIGGFDERFAPAYYEDSDLAFAVRNLGYSVLYQPLSVVVHFEGVSNGTDLSEGQKSYQIANQQKFLQKWKEVLDKEHYDNGCNVFKARNRSGKKKHLLVVDHYVPMHDKDAGNKCSFMYMKLFVQLGFQVTFIGDNFFKHEPYATELAQIGVEILYGNYYYSNWKKWIEEYGSQFDFVYLQRPHIAEKYIDIIKRYSNAKIIYFGHDLHYLREYREYELEKKAALLKSSLEWKKKEFSLFSKADVIYVVGNYEQNILMKEFPNKPIRNIPVYIYDTVCEAPVENFTDRENLLFVGGFGHSPNIDAVLWFAKEIFPEILRKNPGIKWYIVGSKPTKEILSLADDHIIVTGFISDEELDILYHTCRLAIVPLRVGAGVKGKVVEAVYNQIPLVTTPIGAEGISQKENAFLVQEPNLEMITVIDHLYNNYDQLNCLSRNCKAFIQNYFTTDQAKKIVLEDFY